jgi:CBS domain-containing protein
MALTEPMKLSALCNFPVVTALASDSLSEVARRMTDQHVGTVVVVRTPGELGSQVRGIVTDRDIVRAQLRRAADLSSIRAEEAMTSDVLTLKEDESVDSAIAHLRGRRVRRAPVIRHDGTLLGVVSTDDLLAQVARNVITVAAIVTRQGRLEAP